MEPVENELAEDELDVVIFFIVYLRNTLDC